MSFRDLVLCVGERTCRRLFFRLHARLCSLWTFLLLTILCACSVRTVWPCTRLTCVYAYFAACLKLRGGSALLIRLSSSPSLFLSKALLDTSELLEHLCSFRIVDEARFFFFLLFDAIVGGKAQLCVLTFFFPCHFFGVFLCVCVPPVLRLPCSRVFPTALSEKEKRKWEKRLYCHFWFIISVVVVSSGGAAYPNRAVATKQA